MDKVMFSSKSVEWYTPQKLFDDLNSEFKFTLDVCANSLSNKCKNYFDKSSDGLKQDWTKHICYMNPPYGKEIYRWMKKAWETAKNGGTVVCLVPSRTDTKWWHDFVQDKAEVRFIKGRLKFANSKYSAPFPSALVIYRGNDK